MPTYMTQFSYSNASLKGMVETPQDRRAAAEKLFAAAGGKILNMYFCFGDYDGVVIAEFPGDTEAASALLAAGASGGFSNLSTTILIPTDDAVRAMEGANRILGSYKPPSA